MKALIGSPVSNAKNLGGDKEMTATLNVVVVKDRKIHEPITVRWYMGRSRDAQNVLCSVWIKGDRWNSGHGVAGGYGYHKKSEAFARALDDANISLNKPVGGRGDSAVWDACDAIVRALGYRSKPYFVENG